MRLRRSCSRRAARGSTSAKAAARGSFRGASGGGLARAARNGGTAAWALAKQLGGDHDPFFAPIAAFIALNAPLGERGLNAVRLIAGVLLGIAVGEATVAAFGGYGGLAVGTFVAATLAILLGGSRIMVAQAATGAILVITVADEPGLYRLTDAVVGGCVAIAFSQTLFSPEPVRLLRRAEASAISGIADGLQLTARARLAVAKDAAADAGDGAEQDACTGPTPKSRAFVAPVTQNNPSPMASKTRTLRQTRSSSGHAKPARAESEDECPDEVEDEDERRIEAAGDVHRRGACPIARPTRLQDHSTQMRRRSARWTERVETEVPPVASLGGRIGDRSRCMSASTRSNSVAALDSPAADQAASA